MTPTTRKALSYLARLGIALCDAGLLWLDLCTTCAEPREEHPRDDDHPECVLVDVRCPAGGRRNA
jgi:hypothetical protein